MSKITVIQEFKGFKLLSQEETDEYLRVFRTIYIITNPLGQRVGNIYNKLDTAEKIFEQIKQDML